MDLKIVEGIASVWHYHLSFDNKIALCGNKQIMPTRIPLKCWGYYPEHMPTSYCEECEYQKEKYNA